MTPAPEVLFQDSVVNVYPIQFENITAEAVQKAARRTRGGYGALGDGH